jgi:4-hydroxybenzoate polyprenyltransferase
MVKNIKNYLKILRINHYPKQLFLIPGFIYAFFILEKNNIVIKFSELILDVITCFFIVSITASANYCINEFLDADNDKHHPLKKYRPAVLKKINIWILGILYITLATFVLIYSFNVNKSFFISTIVFLVSGLAYNVKPFRTKDIKILDVLSESFMNPVRLYLSYNFFVDEFDIPFYFVLSYWAGGAFLMACKRMSEKLYLKDPKVIKNYRPSIYKYKLKELKFHIKIYATISMLSAFLFLYNYDPAYSWLSLSFIFFFIDYYKISSQQFYDIQTPEKLFTNIFYLIKISIFFGIVLLLLLFYENFKA